MVVAILTAEHMQADKARASFALFVKEAWHVIEPSTPFVSGWHIDAIAEHLQAITHGQLHKLLVNMPPRHAKSTLISTLWPVWTWLNTPSVRWLCASYALSLSIRDNRKCRLLIRSQWFQSRYGSIFKMSGDQNVKGRFENDQRGYRLAVSVGSATTGEGGDTLLIDDPHPIDDSTSDVSRLSTLQWFDETWSSRLNNQDTGAMVVVGQRIHSEDLSGHILEQGGWEHLNLPTEYEELEKCRTSLGWSDPRTQEGDLLWSERFSQETLTRLHKQLGPTAYAAQYQQRPVPAGGGTFKQRDERVFSITYDSYILHTPKGDRAVKIDDCTHFIAVDPAISEKQSADFCVIQSWAKTPISDLLLIDQRRDHWSHPDQQDQIEEAFDERQNEFVAVETVAYQAALFQDLLNKGIPCRPFKPQTDKVARAGNAAIWQQNGKMYFLANAHYLEDLRKELYRFPKAPKDDQVDAISLASIVVRSRGPLSDDRDDYEQVIPDPIEGPLTLSEYEHQEEEKLGLAGTPLQGVVPIVRRDVPETDPFKWIAMMGGGGDDE